VARLSEMTSRAVVPPVVSPVGQRLRAWLRSPAWWLLAGLPGVLSLLVVLALAGAARDDAAIDARTGRATAQVLAVTPVRTVVQFAAPDGQIHSPDEGLAYPSGLRVGQLVRVEYDRADPELVRVAGRTWTVGLLPAGLTLVVLWMLVLPAAWWLRFRIR
jgi:hypothetical protein